MTKLSMILELLQPQTTIETEILNHDLVQDGLWWGKPRPGHEEGEIVKHVQYILFNINQLSVPGSGPSNDAVAVEGSDLWKKLRLIAILHDTFKFQVNPHLPKSGANHHAVRARKFASDNFPAHYDASMLDVLELHDEAYNAWCKGDRDGKWDKAEERAAALHARLAATNSVNLFMQFYTCDTHIGDVERPDWEWFKKYCKDNHGEDHLYFLPITA